jgi:hypothetical protein
MIIFFKKMEFGNYWIQSGSNTLIREMIKDEKLSVEQFSGLSVEESFITEPGEIDNTPPEGFLYQAGYLTLRENPDSESSFFLDYPNFEVRSSLSKLFMDVVLQSESEASKVAKNLKTHFRDGDITGIVSDFSDIIAINTYDDFAAFISLKLFIDFATNNKMTIRSRLIEAVGLSSLNASIKQIKKAIKEDKIEEAVGYKDLLIKESGFSEEIIVKFGEHSYRSVLLSFISGAGVRVTPERHSILGRSDLVVETDEKTYVIEIKVTMTSKDAEKASVKAIHQILDKAYQLPYSDPILLGLGISEEERNIVACVYVENNEAKKLTITKDPPVNLDDLKPKKSTKAPKSTANNN